VHDHAPDVIHVHPLPFQRGLQCRIPDYHGWVSLIKQEVISYDLLQPREDFGQRARLPEAGHLLLEVSLERRSLLELVFGPEVLLIHLL
jgi:hypothetical protein